MQNLLFYSAFSNSMHKRLVFFYIFCTMLTPAFMWCLSAVLSRKFLPHASHMWCSLKFSKWSIVWLLIPVLSKSELSFRMSWIPDIKPWNKIFTYRTLLHFYRSGVLIYLIYFHNANLRERDQLTIFLKAKIKIFL